MPSSDKTACKPQSSKNVHSQLCFPYIGRRYESFHVMASKFIACLGGICVTQEDSRQSGWCLLSTRFLRRFSRHVQRPITLAKYCASLSSPFLGCWSGRYKSKDLTAKGGGLPHREAVYVSSVLFPERRQGGWCLL